MQTRTWCWVNEILIACFLSLQTETMPVWGLSDLAETELVAPSRCTTTLSILVGTIGTLDPPLLPTSTLKVIGCSFDANGSCVNMNKCNPVSQQNGNQMLAILIILKHKIMYTFNSTLLRPCYIWFPCRCLYSNEFQDAMNLMWNFSNLHQRDCQWRQCGRWYVAGCCQGIWCLHDLLCLSCFVLDPVRQHQPCLYTPCFLDLCIATTCMNKPSWTNLIRSDVSVSCSWIGPPLWKFS